jgi:hypothetical protein
MKSFVHRYVHFPHPGAWGPGTFVARSCTKAATYQTPHKWYRVRHHRRDPHPVFVRGWRGGGGGTWGGGGEVVSGSFEATATKKRKSPSASPSSTARVEHTLPEFEPVTCFNNNNNIWVPAMYRYECLFVFWVVGWVLMGVLQILILFPKFSLYSG